MDEGAIGQTFYERAVMLDTGPLVSLFDPRDQRSTRVADALQQFRASAFPVYVTNVIIAEAQNRIMQDVGMERSLAFMDRITDGSVNIESPSEEDLVRAIELIRRYEDAGVSLADAVSMSVMERKGIFRILTFDSDFDLHGFERFPPIY